MGVAAAVPWVTFNFRSQGGTEQFPLTILDLFNIFVSSGGTATQAGTAVTKFSTSAQVMMASLILYTAALAAGILTFLISRLRVVSGGGGIAAGVAWVVGDYLLKNYLVQESISGATVVGTTPSSALANMVVTGYGPYLAVVGGVAILASAFLSGNLITGASYGAARAPKVARQASVFLDERVTLLFKKLGVISFTMVDRDRKSAVVEVTGSDGKNVLVFCEYRLPQDPVTATSLNSFARVVQEELKNKKVVGGLYVTNGDFERGCKSTALVTLIDGKKMEALFKSK
jgi:hypothetical protein